MERHFEDFKFTEKPNECPLAEHSTGRSGEEVPPVLQRCTADVTGIVPIFQ
jgi:hypothetical protein